MKVSCRMEQARGELNDLCKIEGGMSDWEVNFIESVYPRFQKAYKGGWELSEKQLDIIHRIREKLC